MKRAREYRAMARETLGHDLFGSKWLWALLVLFLESLLLGLVSATIIGAIVSVILVGPLTFGLIRIFLRIARKEDDQADINYLFDGFKEKFSESFITSLLVGIFTFLWSLLLIVPGIIKSYAYSASMYLVHERNMEGTQAITESRKLMYGHKWQAFCLDLSFIGWYIVGFLCLGVGVLWVDAYHAAAKVHFYEDILAKQEVIDVE